MSAPMHHPDITGVILAGGQGRRMGGFDKGWLEFDGQPLVAHVVARLSPQVASIVISANQNLERYAGLNCPVVPDVVSGYAGPLAGLHAAMQRITTGLAVTAPCDSPLLPMDLVDRLHRGLVAANADVAVARTGGRRQPVFSLVRRATLPQLSAFLERGERKVELWHATLQVTVVDFDDESDAFSNINTPDDLDRLESRGHPNPHLSDA